MKADGEKLAVRIARELALDILNQGWPIGHNLGTEASLLRRLKVSREPFREAVRILERQGFVRAGRGRNGGLTIQTPALVAASNIVRTYLEFIDVSFYEAYPVHQMLLRIGFEWGIARMTPAHANTLRRYVDGSAHTFRSRDQEGRTLSAVMSAVVEIAATPCLSMLHAMLTRVVADFGHQEKYPAKLWAELSHKMWALVTTMAESAARRDTKSAIAALDESFSYVNEIIKGLERRNRRVWNTESFLSGSYSSAILAQRMEDKVGIALAYDIIAEIRRNRLEPGAKLGSENELAKRFGVGRSTFREAVRTLEFFGVATVQRGSNGGLTVLEPDPSMVIETAVLYLQYLGLEQTNTDALADWLQVHMAKLIAARATHQELHQLIEEVQALAQTKPRSQAPRAGQLLHRWCNLADNRVLALCTEIVWAARSAARGSKGSRSKAQADYARTLSAAASGLRVATAGSSEQALAKALVHVAGGVSALLA